MEISRILRIIITIFLVATFIVVTVAAYRQNQRIKSMTRLSDATTSLATRLTSQELAWVDDEGNRHPFVLDASKLDGLKRNYRLPGENLGFRASIIFLEDNSEHEIIQFSSDLPDERMRCSLSLPATIRLERGIRPAKLKVISWFA